MKQPTTKPITGHKPAAVHRGYSHHEMKTVADAVAKMPGLKDANEKA